MPEEILPGLFRMEIPLPNNPLKTLNSYVITGRDRNMVVDTGFNRPECLAAMRAGLDELGVDLARTDFFITHMHADHAGLVATLKTDTSRVWCSGADADVINRVSMLALDDPWWGVLHAFACQNGFPPAEAEAAISRHPGFRLGPQSEVAFTAVAEGDRITAGDYSFTCLATPGHTGGHICLYEPAAKILISGDHVLRDITPNISHWRVDGDPLSQYMASLARVAALDVTLVLPGHRRLFADFGARVAELVAHHRRRADEADVILTAGPLTAYEVAAAMTWDLTYSDWSEFPPPQKWFAVGEAIAHLRYLESEGRAARRDLPDKVIYEKTTPV